MDKYFEKYSVGLQKLRDGLNELDFDLDSAFFEHFEHSEVVEGDLKAKALITKYNTHHDVVIKISGYIELACDRCTEAYKYGINCEERVVFAYDEKLDFETEEVILIDRDSNFLDLSQEFYDFIILQIPIRKVPEAKVHECSSEVMELINAEGEEADNQTEEIDPRWEKLKKLKDNQ